MRWRMILLLLMVSACWFVVKLFYIYVRMCDTIAWTGLEIGVGCVLVAFSQEYLGVKYAKGFFEIFEVIARHASTFVVSMIAAVILLCNHPAAYCDGIAVSGPLEGVIRFISADPELLRTAAETDKRPPAPEPAAPPVSATPSAGDWNEAAYCAFFHTDDIEAGTLEAYWAEVIGWQYSRQKASGYRPEELPTEVTDRISAIAMAEADNLTVDDWLGQCAAHEKLQVEYPSTTFSNYLANDYHNLLKCGSSENVSPDKLLLWYSRAVQYRVVYLGYANADRTGFAQMVRWIGKRYEEISNDAEHFGPETRAHARANADVLFSLEAEYKG